MAEPHMVDVDGLLLLNIWSSAGLNKKTLYPSIKKIDDKHWKPSIVFIGDSFSDQIRFALHEADVYSTITMSGYFQTREFEDLKLASTQVVKTAGKDFDVKDLLIKDVIKSDIVILEMVDYNVGRFGYGFTDYFLDKLSTGRKEIQISSISGSYGRENDDKSWWHWVEHEIKIKLQSFFIPDDAIKTKLSFEYGTRTNQKLTMQIVMRDGSKQFIYINCKHSERLFFQKVFDVPPKDILEVIIETDGDASPLGNGDSRFAAWIIRNIIFSPVFKSNEL
jgi:hypothetical protein